MIKESSDLILLIKAKLRISTIYPPAMFLLWVVLVLPRATVELPGN